MTRRRSGSPGTRLKGELTNEKRTPGCFRVYRGLTTTHLCGDYFMSHYKDPVTKQPGFNRMSCQGFVDAAEVNFSRDFSLQGVSHTKWAQKPVTTGVKSPISRVKEPQ